jgi:predicted enzyme related to lactoylglutathione lyase
MLQPNAFILYVDNLVSSTQFYEDLLGIKSEQMSPTFSQFSLTPQMGLGLKSRQAVQPPTEKTGGGELAFVVDHNHKVDDLFQEWQKKDIEMIHVPTIMPFGYSFMAIDPNGNRLRVVSLNVKQ